MAGRLTFSSRSAYDQSQLPRLEIAKLVSEPKARVNGRKDVHTQ